MENDNPDSNLIDVQDDTTAILAISVPIILVNSQILRTN